MTGSVWENSLQPVVSPGHHNSPSSYGLLCQPGTDMRVWCSAKALHLPPQCSSHTRIVSEAEEDPSPVQHEAGGGSFTPNILP